MSPSYFESLARCALDYAGCTSPASALELLDRATLREGRMRRRLMRDAGRMGLSNDGEIVRLLEGAVEI